VQPSFPHERQLVLCNGKMRLRKENMKIEQKRGRNEMLDERVNKKKSMIRFL